MTFQPMVPLSGYAGWAFLQRTLDTQTEQFARSPLNGRDISYFKENIANVTNAGDLVSDFRLLRVALSAYGLQEDQPNKAFIRKVLEDGTSDSAALSNRLADKRYRTFSEAFGFGGTGRPKTQDVGFADKVLARFQNQEFERAVGEQSQDMRLALTTKRELPEIVAKDHSNDTAWLTVMGNPPLRKVFETAFGLPDSFGLLDLDRQLDGFKERARDVVGTDQINELSQPEKLDELLRFYLGRSQINSINQISSSASIALTLLQGTG